MNKTFPDRLPETSRLISFLEPQSISTIVSYPEISEIIRRNAQGDGRGIVGSAIKWLQNNKSQIWGTVRRVGLKRLDDGEIVDKGRSNLRKVNRTANRAAKVVRCVRYENLSRDQKQEHDALLVGLRTIQLFSRKDGFEKVKAAIPENGAILPDVKKVMELFI